MPSGEPQTYLSGNRPGLEWAAALMPPTFTESVYSQCGRHTSVPPTFTEHVLGLQGGRNEPGFPLLTWTQTTTSQGSW